MGSKRDQRAQKKREKNRKKRDAARKNRGSRAAPVIEASGRVRGLSAEECARWPVGECFLSQNWHEHGPTVVACFTRQHEDGRVAAVFCDIELEAAGVTQVLYRAPVTADGALGEVARRSEEAGVGIQVDDPARVVKVIHTGLDLGAAGEDLVELRSLLGDLDPRACPDEVLTGRPPPPPPRKRSLFSMLFGD